MRTHLLFPLASLVLLAGCSTTPDNYAPPEQRGSTKAPPVAQLGHYVAMNDPAAETYFVRDISPGLEAGSWRWVHRRPELKFYIEDDSNLKFEMDFAIPAVTLKDTGPVTLSVLINGTLLGKFRYDTEGQKHLERKVPPGMLKPKAINYVVIEPDKVYIAKQDGAALGFILSGAGFSE